MLDIHIARTDPATGRPTQFEATITFKQICPLATIQQQSDGVWYVWTNPDPNNPDERPYRKYASTHDPVATWKHLEDAFGTVYQHVLDTYGIEPITN